MTDPARAQLRERLLKIAEQLRRGDECPRDSEDCQWQKDARYLEEAASRLGEPEAPAPQVVVERPKVITDLLAVDNTGVVANYIRRLEAATVETTELRKLVSLMYEAEKPSPVSAREPEALLRRCTCWLGRHGSTFGSSVEREQCAIHGDASPLVRTSQSVDQDQEDQTRGGKQADSEVSSPPQPPTGVLSATAPEWLLIAERIARQAHAGQTEESTGDDYIHHIERVAR